MTGGSRDDLVALFLDEAGERLARMEGLLATLEEDGGEAATVALRRELHALKGASRMMGLHRVSELCHAAEDLVEADAAAAPRALAQQCRRIAEEVGRLAGEGPGVPEPGRPSSARDELPRGARRGRDEIRVGAAVIDELADRGARLRVLAAGAAGLVERVGRLAGLAELAAHDREPRQILATLATSLRQAALEIESGQRSFDRLAEQQLQTLLRLQVQPLRPFLRSLADHAQELAVSLGKEVSVAAEAGDAQLDRRIVNSLREAFLHLVRNAVDHGIEAPADRRRAGKPEAGAIRIGAATEGDRVRVQIADDGCGIDERAVLGAAVARGLVEREQASGMDRAAVLNLLMLPSFSTRDRTSEVSGRGIGLDAVAAVARSVGGDVWLESSVGSGTTVTVEVPVARRGDRVLVLRAAGHLVALPSAPVQAFRRLPAAAVEESDGRYLVRLGGRLLEPHFLAGANLRPAAGSWILLEMVVGGVVVAVVADQVVGEEEVIVRPIPPAAGAPRGFEGMATLASGRPVPVLSLRHLAPGADVEVGPRRPAAAEQRRPLDVLLVDDSAVTRELFRSLLEDGGFRVVTAGAADEAIRILGDRRIDCVVTDIEMPGMNGLDLTRRLRNDERFADLPVIVISTRDRPSDRRAGLEAGADAYLTKQGLDARRLIALVARVGGLR